jgi:uncharacterized cupredoxin-like copper-binding protein
MIRLLPLRKNYFPLASRTSPLDIKLNNSDEHHNTNKKGHGDEQGHIHSDGSAVHVNIKAGETSEIEFIANLAGRYQYVCTVPGHQEAGMLGELVVQN